MHAHKLTKKQQSSATSLILEPLALVDAAIAVCHATPPTPLALKPFPVIHLRSRQVVEAHTVTLVVASRGQSAGPRQWKKKPAKTPVSKISFVSLSYTHTHTHTIPLPPAAYMIQVPRPRSNVLLVILCFAKDAGIRRRKSKGTKVHARLQGTRQAKCVKSRKPHRERERERERGLMKWGIGSRMLALGADGKRETNL